MNASTAGPGLDHQHDLAGPLQAGAEFRDRMRADDATPLPAPLDEVVHLGNGSVEDRHGVTVSFHVQDQVLAHDGQADKADIC